MQGLWGWSKGNRRGHCGYSALFTLFTQGLMMQGCWQRNICLVMAPHPAMTSALRMGMRLEMEMAVKEQILSTWTISLTTQPCGLKMESMKSSPSIISIHQEEPDVKGFLSRWHTTNWFCCIHLLSSTFIDVVQRGVFQQQKPRGGFPSVYWLIDCFRESYTSVLVEFMDTYGNHMSPDFITAADETRCQAYETHADIDGGGKARDVETKSF